MYKSYFTVINISLNYAFLETLRYPTLINVNQDNLQIFQFQTIQTCFLIYFSLNMNAILIYCPTLSQFTTLQYTCEISKYFNF